MSDKLKLSEHLKEKISLSIGRYDLRPSEAHNTGYSVEQHDRAAIASECSNSIDIDLPASKPVTAPADDC